MQNQFFLNSINIDREQQLTTGSLAICWLDIVSFGRRNSVRLLFVSFNFCIFIGLRFRADDFQIPPHCQAVSDMRQ